MYNRASSPSYCIEPCARGLATASPGLLDPTKCHGRADSSCATNGGCMPSCAGDADCEGGDACDLHHGLCKTGLAPVDAGIGATASAGCGTQMSASFSDGDAGTAFYCTGYCTIGVLGGCGWEGPSPPAPVGCVMYTGTLNTAGDRGLCARLCDCDADCAPETRCLQLDATNGLIYGRYGYCYSTFGVPGKPCVADGGS
jgi:hypothetical protein